jgi:4'-phosphopantetheinyl transferase
LRQNWSSIIRLLLWPHKMNIKHWQEPREDVNFSTQEMQVWSASLETEDSSCFYNLLSEDEKKRAARMKSRSAANGQIIGRGILRLLLGKYIGVNPRDLVFSKSPFGKPFLSNPMDSAISFNLTHSGSLLLVAIGKGTQVGIDVEKIEENIDFSGISSLVFSSAEQRSLSRSHNPILDFYALWTAKEAILKASGHGFSYPSNQLSVVISKGSATLPIIPAELTGCGSCSLSSFSPAEGYSAAVAVLQ